MRRRIRWVQMCWVVFAAAVSFIHVSQLDRLLPVYPGPHQGYVPVLHWSAVVLFASAVATVLGLRIRDAVVAAVAVGITSDLLLSLAATVRESRRPDFFDNRIFFIYLELAIAILFSVAGLAAGWVARRAIVWMRDPAGDVYVALSAPFALVYAVAVGELLVARAWLPFAAATIAGVVGVALGDPRSAARRAGGRVSMVVRRSDRALALASAAAIFVLVVAFNASLGAQVGDRFPLASDDGDAYHAVGLAMATGHLDFRGYQRVEHTWEFRSPGYPIFIAAVYRFFPGSFFAVGVAQAAVAALSVWLPYVLGSRLFDPRVAALAAWLTATSGLVIQAFAGLFSESIYATVGIALVLILVVARRRSAVRWRAALLAAAGLLLAYGILVKPQMEAFIPIALGWWLLVRRGAIRAAMAEIAIPLLAVVLVLAPVLARDVEANGRMTLLNQRHAAETWKISELGLRLIPFGVVDPSMDRLADAFGRQPAEVARAIAEAIPSAVSQVFLGASFGKADPLQLQRASSWAHALNVYTPLLAILGFAVLWRRWTSDRPGQVLLAGYVLANALVFVLLAQALVRYRIPLDPLLFLWVAAGAVWLYEVVRRHNRALATRTE